MPWIVPSGLACVIDPGTPSHVWVLVCGSSTVVAATTAGNWAVLFCSTGHRDSAKCCMNQCQLLNCQSQCLHCGMPCHACFINCLRRIDVANLSGGSSCATMSLCACAVSSHVCCVRKVETAIGACYRYGGSRDGEQGDSCSVLFLRPTLLG